MTFPRLPDHERGYALVERDDGVVYRLYGGVAGPRLPHDIRHLVVERELRIRDGLWGGIAAGVVFKSMRYVGGRRPPHAAERSATLLRTFRDRGLRAEMLANLVESVAALDHPSADQIRKLAASQLAALPDAGVDPVAIAAAAGALQVEAARWARLRVGEELCYDWPSPVRQQAPRIVRISKKSPKYGAEPGQVAFTGMGQEQATQTDLEMMELALRQARISLDSGGVPVGAVLATGGQLVAVGHNERVQRGDPVAHGEIACLRNAGRRASYADTTLYTTLSPCQMCSGAILLFQIPRVVVGEAETFEGDLGFLTDQGVQTVLLDDDGCKAVMREFQVRFPLVWSEDIGGR